MLAPADPPQAGAGLHPHSAEATSAQLQPLPGKRRPGSSVRRSAKGQTRHRPVLRSAVELAPAPAVRGLGTGLKQRDAETFPTPVRPAQGGSDLRTELDVAGLLDRAPGKRRRWAARLVVDAGERVFDLPLVAADGVEHDTTTLARTEEGWYRLHARVGAHRRLVVVRQPVPVDEVPRRERLRAKVGRLRPR